MFGLARKVAGSAAIAGAALYATTNNSTCGPAVRQAYQKFMPTMDFPDLSEHNNCMAKVLTPKLYAKLRDLVSYMLGAFIGLFFDPP